MRRITAAATISAVTVLTGLLTVPAVASESVDENSPVSVEIISPVAGAHVAGTVEFTLHITAEPGTTPTTATVRLAGTYSPDRVRTATVDVPDDCGTGCDVTVPVDTMTRPEPALDPDVVDPMLDEHSGQLVEARVTADTDTGAVTATAETHVYVRNGRPLLSVQVVSPPTVGTATTVPVYMPTQLMAAGQVIDRVDLTIFGNGQRRDLSFPAPAPEPMSALIRSRQDVSIVGLPDGVYTVRGVAYDTTGKPSDMAQDRLVVYSRPTVTIDKLEAANPSPTVDGNNAAAVTVTYSNGPGWPYWPQLLEIWIDDAPYAPSARVQYFPDYCPTGECVNRISHTTFRVPANTLWGEPLTPGPHKVRVRYTEVTARDLRANPTATATVDITKTVPVAGVQAKFTVLGPVAEGVGGELKATLTGVAGTTGPRAGVVSWRASEDHDGAPTLASGKCTGTSCTDVTALIPLKSLSGGYSGQPVDMRLHVIRLTVKDTTGVTHTYLARVNVDAKTHILFPRPAKTAAYGTKVKLLVGVQQSDNQPMSKVPVTFQARTAGSSTWRTVATATTNANGQAVAYPVVTHNTTWRAVVAQRPGYNGPGTSTTVSTVVSAKVTLTGVPTAPVRGKAYRVAATVKPTSTGRMVYIQTRTPTTSWRTVAKPTTDKYGVARANVTFGRGTTYVRAIAVALTPSAAGTSGTAKAVAK